MTTQKLLGTLSLASLILFGSCAKKTNMLGSSTEKEFQKLSREIENSPTYASTELITSDIAHKTSEAKALSEPVIVKKLANTANSKLQSKQTTVSQVKSEAKQEIKQQKKGVFKLIEKAKSGINQNLKIGIVLILVGLVISLLPISSFSLIGSIVALIGLIFLILGIIEYL